MKKAVLVIFCLIFALTGCTWKRIEDRSTAAGDNNTTSVAYECPSGYPDGTNCVKGYFLEGKTGTPLIIVDDSPIVMSQHPDIQTEKAMFDDFTDGDLIHIYCDAIMESYPGQTNVYGVMFLEDGDIENINEDVLKSLEEMGWIELETGTSTDIGICFPEPEIEELTGYYIKANDEQFIIVDDEPIYVYPHPDMVEDIEVLYGFSDGDLINICCELRSKDNRKEALIWNSRLIEEGSFDNISDEAFEALADYGYIWCIDRE